MSTRLTGSQKSVLTVLKDHPTPTQLALASGLDPGRAQAHHIAQLTSLSLGTTKNVLMWARRSGWVKRTWPLEHPWRITAVGIEVLAQSDTESDWKPKGRPKGMLLFTKLDECVLWTIGNNGMMHLEVAAQAQGVTYAGIYKAINKALLACRESRTGSCGWIVVDQTEKRAGWFFGRLNDWGVELFQLRFPNSPPPKFTC